MSDTIDGMQIKKILTAVLLEFENNKIPYALVGALAFAYWGYKRFTHDIDFLVRKSDVVKVKAIMEKYGYSIEVDTVNATQFTHKLKDMVGVDYIYASTETSLRMIEEARGFEMPEGQHIHVALPEDLIGLKLQAISLNPKREYKDMADIQAIVQLIGDRMEWEKIKEYCGILGMEGFYEKIRKFTDQ